MNNNTNINSKTIKPIWNKPQFPTLQACVLISYVTLVLLGFISICSASKCDHNVMVRHLAHMGLSCIIVAAIYKRGVGFLHRYAYLAFGASFIMLMLLRFFGSGKGASRWLNLYIFNIQPSEIMKFAIIICLARYFADIQCKPTLKFLFLPIIITGIAFYTILVQPDLGTALILLVCSMSILFFARVSMWFFITQIIVALVCFPILWNLMYDYQRARVITLISGNSDVYGAGYQIMQSKIAIGSGQIFGKGFMNGTQCNLNFLPEKSTDFIFALFGEENGFRGVFLLLFAYFMLIVCGFILAMRARDTFCKLIITGSVVVIFLHVFINISMVTGLLPVVGLPLPFISYGGSSLVVFSVCVAIIAFGNRRK
jgi:rod shape determining protein RodA